jgi:hypothetical protein
MFLELFSDVAFPGVNPCQQVQYEYQYCPISGQGKIDNTNNVYQEMQHLRKVQGANLYMTNNMLQFILRFLIIFILCYPLSDHSKILSFHLVYAPLLFHGAGLLDLYCAQSRDKEK